jgi:hypothetical protein
VLPPPPATFSITIGWPSDRRIGSTRTREMASVAPPGGNGTIRVIGREGYVCADAAPTTVTVKASAIAAQRRTRMSQTPTRYEVLTLFAAY